MPNMSLKKNEMPSQAPEVRNKNFLEAALGYTQEQAEEAKRRLEDKLHSDVEITLVAGGQPVYYFIVSVE